MTADRADGRRVKRATVVAAPVVAAGVTAGELEPELPHPASSSPPASTAMTYRFFIWTSRIGLTAGRLGSVVRTSR